ncbi:hypothetical protein ECTW15901_2372, partial [Escherichia coli TW15901]
TALK